MVAAQHPRTGLASPRFVSFLVAQFLGAVNDNAFKATLTTFVLWSVTDETIQVRYSSLATALFPLPFLLFSPIAGYLADRFRKSSILPLVKAPELLAMGLAILALRAGSLPMLMTVLFLMATQSAFFSPAKYGLIPEALDNRQLSMANGLLQMTTNLAILIGAATGVAAFGLFKNRLERIGWIYLAIAVAGTLAALFVPRTPAGNRRARREWLVFTSSWRDWQVVRQRPELVQTIWGIAYFYFLGSVFLAVIPVYGANVLGLSVERSAALLMVLSVGIAAGSLAAGRLSRGRIEIGLVPLGSLGMTLFATTLVVTKIDTPRLWGIPLSATILLLLLGLSAGIYFVPLNALLQQRSPEGMKGRLIAFSNVVTFAAVLAAGGLTWLLTDSLGFMSEQLVLSVSLLTGVVTIYILLLLPDYFVRSVLYLLTNLFYRIEVEGNRNLPAGGALLVANHVSWVDSLLIGSACDRMVRFMMYRPYYEARGVHWLFRRMRAIPIASHDTAEQKAVSLARACEEIERGNVVCIFAEGSLTRSGHLLRFRRGLESIARGSGAPIVPVYLDGMWGSVFSWEGGRLLFKWPRRIREPVQVRFGPALSPTASAPQVRRAVQELSVEAFARRRANHASLAAAFLRTARRFGGRRFLQDAGGRSVTFGEALVRADALRAELFDGSAASRSSRVGLLVPNDVRGALASLATLLDGRTLVHLAADHGPEHLLREIAAARIDRIVIGDELVARRGLSPALTGKELVSIDRAEGALPATGPDGLRRRSRLLPARRLRARLARTIVTGPDRPAAIVFSVAPHLDGMPRGAVLSHHNILSNMESLRQVFRISRDDVILGLLPFSDSFGLFATLLLPAVVGLPVLFAGSDVESPRLSRAAREAGVSLAPLPAERLAALAGEKRLERLRYAVVAGGTLSAEDRERFLRTHGVEPVEGFGCAECGPLVSLELPADPAATPERSGPAQRTRGRPLPGIAVRILDAAGACERAPGEPGELWVRGANVMQGYFEAPEITRGVLCDGWYRTGYRAALDEDGFLSVFPET